MPQFLQQHQCDSLSEVWPYCVSVLVGPVWDTHLHLLMAGRWVNAGIGIPRPLKCAGRAISSFSTLLRGCLPVSADRSWGHGAGFAPPVAEMVNSSTPGIVCIRKVHLCISPWLNEATLAALGWTHATVDDFLISTTYPLTFPLIKSSTYSRCWISEHPQGASAPG